MNKYRKKPIVVEAVQYKCEITKELASLINSQGRDVIPMRGGLVIKTPEGDMIARRFDWIIKGVNGELYPCKHDIFEKTYEAVEDSNE